MLDQLAVPLFESEMKRSSANTKATSSINKMAIQIPEGGTSVAPRQRPKGSAQPSSHSLPLVAPPSPLPKHAISSPVPTNEIVEPFSAQFQANFPPVTASQPTTPAASVPVTQLPPQPVVTAAVTTQQQTSNSITNINQVENLATEKHSMENVFETKFPDPFKDPQTTPTRSESAGIQHQVSGTATELVGTPTKNVNLLIEPKVGHRRNMSDTSAFNKYEFSIN